MIRVVFLILSAVALGMASVVMAWNHLEHNDEMFKNLAIGFLLACLARVISVMNAAAYQYGWWSIHADWVDRFAPLALAGMSAVFFVIAAINGSRVYRETPYLLGAAVLVGAAIGATYPVTSPSASMPTVFVLVIGNIFAAVILFRKWTDDKQCLALYRILSVLFALRVVTSLMSVWLAGRTGTLANTAAALSVAITIGFVVFGSILATARERQWSCQEVAA